VNAKEFCWLRSVAMLSREGRGKGKGMKGDDGSALYFGDSFGLCTGAMCTLRTSLTDSEQSVDSQADVCRHAIQFFCHCAL